MFVLNLGLKSLLNSVAGGFAFAGLTPVDVDYLDRLRTFAAFEFSDGTLKLEASLAEQACLILCCLLPVPQLPLRLSEF